MTTTDLNKKLTSKEPGLKYTYKINNTQFEISEFNSGRGWCLNESWILADGRLELKNSYGYNGFLLRECKDLIVSQWNENNIN